MKVLERLRRQLELIKGYVAELESERSYRGIERLEQLIIQALLDLGVMALSALGATPPRVYAQIGEALHRHGVLPLEEASILRALAGLRNILVHGYAAVEPEKILEYSRKIGRDAFRIAEMIVAAVEARGADPPGPVEKIRSVLQGRVRLAYLFGGRAKGYVLKGDYDVAVYLDGGCDLYALGLIQADLSEALGDERVDVVCLNSAPPELVFEALSGIPIIDDVALRAELYAKALAELNDVNITVKRAYTP
ncbi:MAG: HepT-like ribonuclease domain-containing protein [Pyrobaculum sp.]